MRLSWGGTGRLLEAPQLRAVRAGHASPGRGLAGPARRGSVRRSVSPRTSWVGDRAWMQVRATFLSCRSRARPPGVRHARSTGERTLVPDLDGPSAKWTKARSCQAPAAVRAWTDNCCAPVPSRDIRGEPSLRLLWLLPSSTPILARCPTNRSYSAWLPRLLLRSQRRSKPTFYRQVSGTKTLAEAGTIWPWPIPPKVTEPCR